jgi:hypothetical protein
MVSQALAFNMFLVFFLSRLFALGLMSQVLSGKNGQDLAARASSGVRQLDFIRDFPPQTGRAETALQAHN